MASNHVWAYDLADDRTRDGRRFRMLNVVDEFTRACLAIRVGRKLNAADVVDVLADLLITRGTPGDIRSDNEPEFAGQGLDHRGACQRGLYRAGQSLG